MKRFTNKGVQNSANIYGDLAHSICDMLNKKSHNTHALELSTFIMVTKNCMTDERKQAFAELICGIYSKLNKYGVINDYDENNNGGVDIHSMFYGLGKQIVTCVKNSCKKNATNNRFALLIEMANSRFTSERICDFAKSEFEFLNGIMMYTE